MRKIRFLLGTVCLVALLPVSAADGGEVNLYSYRQPFLIKPMLDEFTQKTNIKVNVVFANKGMLEKIKATPGAADAVLTADIGRLNDMTAAGVLQPVKSSILEKNIPSQYRHPEGLWFGLTTRARVLYVSKKRVKPGDVRSYEDLAKPSLRGRVCIRSGKHVYNVSLIASIIAHKGEAATTEWLKGVKANLARKPGGNDRAQAKAIYAGQCDVGVGNTYYMGKMQTNRKKPAQRKWAAAIRLVFPNQGGRGTHVNISGAAVIRSARNRANAVKLIEFLSGDFAQKIYADQNFEYPVKAGVPVNPRVKSWGDFKADQINLATVAKFRKAASKIVDLVDFNNFRKSSSNCGTSKRARRAAPAACRIHVLPVGRR
ncbi:Fe(3+) ABC transporter substrate-binding protein [Nitrospinota bacterium]